MPGITRVEPAGSAAAKVSGAGAQQKIPTLGLRGGQVHEYGVWGLDLRGKIHVFAENGKRAPASKGGIAGHRAFQLVHAVLAVQVVGRKHQDHEVGAVLRGVHLAGERLACLKPPLHCFLA
jgi:hypothetical protein